MVKSSRGGNFLSKETEARALDRMISVRVLGSAASALRRNERQKRVERGACRGVAAGVHTRAVQRRPSSAAGHRPRERRQPDRVREQGIRDHDAGSSYTVSSHLLPSVPSCVPLPLPVECDALVSRNDAPQYTCEEVLGRSCRFLQGPSTDFLTVRRMGTSLWRRRGGAARASVCSVSCIRVS